MFRSLLACVAPLVLLAGNAIADGQDNGHRGADKPTSVTIIKVDPKHGEIKARYADESGKTQTKVFRLTSDVRLLDETGRVVQLDVFESGDDALVVESGGKLLEIRRTPHRGSTRHLSDTVQSLIEMSESEEGCAQDLQEIYDMLRKLDTGKNGRIDPNALKAEGDRILHERVQRAFQRLDTNGDGKISKNEARGLIKEHFDRIDANKDGFISFDELLTAAKQRREQKAAQVKAIHHLQNEKEKH